MLLIDLVLAMPAEANVFTCRASALRVNKLLGQIFEPVVANPPDIPCATDSKSLASVKLTLPLGILPLPLPLPLPLGSVIKADVVSANTVTAPPHAGLPVTAEGKVTSASILGLVKTGVLDATARVDSVGGKCVLSSKSSVTSALVLGTPVTVVANHLNVTIPLVGILHFNETLGGLHPTSGTPDPGKITQRALWLEITSPLLQTTLGVKDVIVGEAIADFAFGKPLQFVTLLPDRVRAVERMAQPNGPGLPYKPPGGRAKLSRHKTLGR